jgi:hypothetical protein
VEERAVQEVVEAVDQAILEGWDLLLGKAMVWAVESEVKAMLLEAARTQ